MSATIIYALNSKSTTQLKTFRNGWGSAPVLWDYLSEKYLGLDGMPFRENELQRLWDLAQDRRLTAEERICHMITFDRAFVPVKHLDAVGDACMTVYAAMPAKYRGGRVNHWYGIGSLCTTLVERRFHHRCRGVCMAPTTVSDHWHRPNPEWMRNAWSIFKEETGK